MPDFTGKVVIVTGSSTGIGRVTALRFAKAGASVVIHGQSADRLKKTEELLMQEAQANASRVASVRGSVQDEATLREIINTAVDKFGRIDVLVNNVGSIGIPDLEQQSMENFDFVIDVNLKSVIRMTQLVLPHLEKTKGSIVNITSTVARIPFPIGIFYSIAKAGVEQYTRNCAVIFAPKGIRVNCVAPGIVPTQILDRQKISSWDQEKFTQNYVRSRVPLQRVGTAEECAAAIGFLASKGASYTTGAVLTVDGGQIPTMSIVAP